MNHLQQLISQLCPDGVVEFAKLGEVCERLKGTPITASKMKQVQSEDGDITIIAGGKTIVKAFESDIPNANIIRKPSILVQSRGIVDFRFMEEPYTFKNEMWAYTMDNQTTLKFIYYVLKNNIDYFRLKASIHGSMPQISLPITENFEIPLPPLPIQNEIVNILDKFTTLEAELEAELDCRKRQYQFYRDRLLSFQNNGAQLVEWKNINPLHQMLNELCPDGVEVVRLGEVCEIKGRIGFRGYTRADLVDKGDGAISLSPSNINNGQLSFDDCTYLSWSKYEESPEIMVEVGDVIFTKTASVGKTALVKFLPEKATINPQLVVLKRAKCNHAYLSYILKDSRIQAKVKQKAGVGSVPNISQTNLATIEIPLPPLPIQEEVVRILDRFERLTTDLQSGLPAEIHARHQQYEHYRNRLLTFKRKTTE